MSTTLRSALAVAGLALAAQAGAEVLFYEHAGFEGRYFTSERRCWVEREEVTRNRGEANVPGAIVGALIGGVLGHQVGGGRGQDAATAGGAVAGAALGAHVGRDRSTYSRDVQRCASVPSQARPDHWDVTYEFRGREHRMQTTYPPGPTVTVNGRGEPRA